MLLYKKLLLMTFGTTLVLSKVQNLQIKCHGRKRCSPFFAENIVGSVLSSNKHFGELPFKQKQQVFV